MSASVTVCKLSPDFIDIAPPPPCSCARCRRLPSRCAPGGRCALSSLAVGPRRCAAAFPAVSRAVPARAVAPTDEEEEGRKKRKRGRVMKS
uniref:Uncharacterized protein n=1 Tax=Oryza rufipogon TaxID=4529 RepID=A0A0E0Q5C1_ORYRU